MLDHETQPERSYRRVGTIDLDTGEIIEGTPVLPRLKIKYFERNYMVMFLETAENLAMDKTWKFEEQRIFLYLLSKTGMGNYLQATQKEIGQALGIDQANISKAFKVLKNRGIIEVTANLGRSRAYRVSPQFVWRGAGEAYDKERKSRERAKKKALLEAGGKLSHLRLAKSEES